MSVELDREVATKLMGWRKIENDYFSSGYYWSDKEPLDGETFPPGWAEAPKFSSTEDLAWQVLLGWHGNFRLTRQNGEAWKLELFEPSMQWSDRGSDLPLLICTLRLRAAGIVLDVQS